MPVETADDRAAFFNTDEFAEAGRYTPPGGAPVDCTLIVDRGQGRKSMTLANVEAAGTDRLVQVLAEGASPDGITPARNGLFDLLDPDTGDSVELLQVVGEPALDESGTWWTAQVVQVSD